MNQRAQPTFEERLAEHMGWIIRSANRLLPRDCELDDLIQEGRIALWHAHQSYDSERGVKFLSYAGVFIERAMRLWMWKNCGTVRVSLEDYRCGSRPNVVALDSPLPQGSRGKPGTLADILPAPSQEAEAIDRRRALCALSLLPQKLQTVLELTYFENEVDGQIAQAVGCSRSHIAWLREQAVKRIRSCIGEKFGGKKVSRRPLIVSARGRKISAVRKANRK